MEFHHGVDLPDDYKDCVDEITKLGYSSRYSRNGKLIISTTKPYEQEGGRIVK